MEAERLVRLLRGIAYGDIPDELNELMNCPIQLDRNRAIATAAKIIADDPTLPDELAGALMQMCGAGGAKPYEVCDE